MLSPTPSQITLPHPPSLHHIQPPKSSTRKINFKETKNRGRIHPHNLHSFASSATHFPICFRASSSHKNPGATFVDNSSSYPLVDSNVLASTLQKCNAITDIRKLHAMVIKCLEHPVIFVENNLISAYVRLDDLIDARNVFDKMPKRNVVSWTAILNGYVSFGLEDDALRVFKEFVESGVQANSKTFVCVLNLCSRRSDNQLGQQIHACIIKGDYSNLVVDSAMVGMYAQCGDLSAAFRIFDRMPTHDVVSWTTMITACSQVGQGEEAVLLYAQMELEGFTPNEYTVCSVLNACGDEKALKFGRQLHGAIVKKIFKSDVFIGTSLVDMYAKCGEIADSRKVFDGMRKRNTVTWTCIIAGYALNGFGKEAISIFRVMKRRNIFANNLTMVSILKACGLVGDLRLAKEIHAQLVKSSFHNNIYIGSTLVWLYCKCMDYSTASKVLREMPFRDVVSWTALISGSAGLGHEAEAIEFLEEMLREGIQPNPFTYSSALKACGRLQNARQGRLIHSYINKTPAFSNVNVGSSLVFMYAECASVAEAIRVFDSMPEQNLVTLTAMIYGYTKNGFCQEALKLIRRMQAQGIEVDALLVSEVLTACGEVDWNMDTSQEHFLQST